MDFAHHARATLQRGNALLVAVILLLLASVITLLTLNVGLFEQRTSGNDVRAKLISEVAEAGIAQGAEYFRMVPTALQPGANWVQCGDNDTTFPCGSIPDMDVDADGDPTTPATVKRRGTMYYWSNGGSPGDINGDGTSNDALDTRMLPLATVLKNGSAAARIGSVGNFNNVAYGVGVVLCRIAVPKTPNDITRCATTAAEQSSTYAYNFVSVAGLPEEGTRTTVSQMLGQYLIFNPQPNKPPIVAAGSVDVTGGLQVVTNPNAGGSGVPVSIWTRKDVSKTGTPNTCYLDEFVRYGAKGSVTPKWEDDMITCDDCNCAGDKSLSYDKSGNAQAEGIDILDIDGNSGVNRDVKPEEFPCDLFAYIFGTQAWQDVTPASPKDNFCETRLPKVDYTTPAGSTVQIYPDEAYLYTNATTIVTRDAAAAAIATTSQKAKPSGLDYPNKEYSGIVWCQVDCDIGPSEQMGTPLKPVLLIIDDSVKIQGRVFGLVFLRSPGDNISPTTGGTATLDMNAGSAVYGSIVVQGSISKANGTAAVIFSGEVFKRLGEEIPPKNSSLPGAWTDRLSY